MLIRIDGYTHDVLLSGKKYAVRQLRERYQLAKRVCENSEDLPYVFARLCQLEVIIGNEEVEVDIVIDTDTERIYCPSY
ncbi:hypothetical protein P4U90_19845 [Cytobacillus kochii]|uniref:hypothetical protein n=1 Tax=Cytobacillus kochii TaxID=859143 RepID=UPI002E20D0A2|nr:hypothetical protein [Cytobacillus kochii]